MLEDLPRERLESAPLLHGGGLSDCPFLLRLA